MPSRRSDGGKEKANNRRLGEIEPERAHDRLCRTFQESSVTDVKLHQWERRESLREGLPDRKTPPGIPDLFIAKEISILEFQAVPVIEPCPRNILVEST